MKVYVFVVNLKMLNTVELVESVQNVLTHFLFLLENLYLIKIGQIGFLLLITDAQEIRETEKILELDIQFAVVPYLLVHSVSPVEENGLPNLE
jgi:hypothetical protein